MYQFWSPLVRFWPPCSQWYNSQYNHIKPVKNAYFHRLTWMLSKYQDKNVETRLKINNNENGHNRYSGHNWMCRKFWTFMWTKIIKKSTFFRRIFFSSSEKLNFDKENVIFFTFFYFNLFYLIVVDFLWISFIWTFRTSGTSQLVHLP